MKIKTDPILITFPSRWKYLDSFLNLSTILTRTLTSVDVLQATEIPDVAERAHHAWRLSKSRKRQQGEYDSLIDEMRQVTKERGGAEVFVLIPANIWLTQTSKSTKSLSTRHLLTFKPARPDCTSSHTSYQLPSCCSRLLLLYCFGFFLLALDHIPCRDMDNDSLLLTSAEHQIAQRYASKLGSAWSNQTRQAHIYIYF